MYLFQILVLEIKIVPGESENANELVHALLNIRRFYQDSDTVPMDAWCPGSLDSLYGACTGEKSSATEVQ